MTAFSQKVAELTGLASDRIETLASGSLSEVLLLRWPDDRCSVAKSSPAAHAEAGMLEAIAAADVPAPGVQAVREGVLLLEHVPNDGAFSQATWADIGRQLRTLHERTGSAFGWPADYAFGKVPLLNRESRDWPRFWAEQRLVPTAELMGGNWRHRVERLASRLPNLLPARPPAALLHGDLWSGNLLVNGGKLAALIDPACYYGDAEVDLAMLELFASPSEAFCDAYGPFEPGWRDRRAIYQLLPALVHLALFGSGYAGMVNRLLRQFDC